MAQKNKSTCHLSITYQVKIHRTHVESCNLPTHVPVTQVLWRAEDGMITEAFSPGKQQVKLGSFSNT